MVKHVRRYYAHLTTEYLASTFKHMQDTLEPQKTNTTNETENTSIIPPQFPATGHPIEYSRVVVRRQAVRRRVAAVSGAIVLVALIVVVGTLLYRRIQTGTLLASLASSVVPTVYDSPYGVTTINSDSKII